MKKKMVGKVVVTFVALAVIGFFVLICFFGL